MAVQLRDVAALSGAGFVGLILAGNTLSMSGVPHPVRPTGEQVLAQFALQSSIVVNQVGIALELVGFAAFAVFLAYLFDVLRRREVLGGAAVLAVIAGALLLAIKLGSAAPHLFGLADHDRLSPEAALVLFGVNGLAFVVAWLPLALFVAAAAVALHQAELIGRVAFWSGLAVGLLGVPVAVVSALEPYSGFAGTFLLSLLWMTVVSVRLAFRPVAGRAVLVPAQA